MKVDQAPVTSSRPTQIGMAPPILVTRRAWRRKKAKARIATWKPNDTSRNGTPKPRAYTKASRAPRAAVPLAADRARTAVSVGPMQGVQPSPNITPSSGAPARPAFGRAAGRTIRPAKENRSKAPANSSPRRIVRTPRICVSRRACPVIRWPSPPSSAPKATKTTEKPSTNSAVPAITRALGAGGGAGMTDPAETAGRAATATLDGATPTEAAWPGGSPATGAGCGPEAPAIPVTNDRYPGTSGRQQGERKVTAPAAAATGNARISGPDVTSWITPLMAPSGRRAAARLPARCAPGNPVRPGRSCHHYATGLRAGHAPTTSRSGRRPVAGNPGRRSGPGGRRGQDDDERDVAGQRGRERQRHAQGCAGGAAAAEPEPGEARADDGQQPQGR